MVDKIKEDMQMSKVMKTMDGNEAVAYASYAFTEVAGIFPNNTVISDG